MNSIIHTINIFSLRLLPKKPNVCVVIEDLGFCSIAIYQVTDLCTFLFFQLFLYIELLFWLALSEVCMSWFACFWLFILVDLWM